MPTCMVKNPFPTPFQHFRLPLFDRCLRETGLALLLAHIRTAKRRSGFSSLVDTDTSGRFGDPADGDLPFRRDRS